MTFAGENKGWGGGAVSKLSQSPIVANLLAPLKLIPSVKSFLLSKAENNVCVSFCILQKHGRDPGCEFKEEYTENRSYTLYRSAHKPNWYLGFKKSGRPLKVTAIHKKSKEDCFKFQKLSRLPTKSRSDNNRKKCKRKNGPPGVDFCQFLRKHKDSIKTSGRKIRHSKSHPRQRNG